MAFVSSLQLLTTSPQSPFLKKLQSNRASFISKTHPHLRTKQVLYHPSTTYPASTSSSVPSNINQTTTSSATPSRRRFLHSLFAVASTIPLLMSIFPSFASASEFKRLVPIQFIAALGDPKASSGTGAQSWGIWRVDPGPRGVWLNKYQSQLVQSNGIAPAGWKFDPREWWLEEHGLIMEPPTFPLPPGRYLVTGDRKITTGLTVDQSGAWKLDQGCLYDVTHLPCRAAKYVPNEEGGDPSTATVSDFPVKPGAEMPTVKGCEKQDYAVLFVVGIAK